MTTEIASQVITPDSGINTTITVAMTFVVATCGLVVRATWKVSNLMRDLRDMADKLRETWSYDCQKDWAHDLERKNRSLRPNLDGTFSLQVPDPVLTRQRTEGRVASGGSSPPL